MGQNAQEQPDTTGLHSTASSPPFMKHPLLIPGLLYVAGILGAWLFSTPLLPLLVVSLALAIAAVVFARLRPWLLYALVPLTGWANFTWHTSVISPHDLRRLLGDQFALVTVRGRLCDTPSLRVYQQGEKESWRTLAQIEVTALCTNQERWQPAAGRMAVTAPGLLTNLFAGQTVEITGVAGSPRGAEAEGTFDYRAYLRQLAIYYSLQTASEQDWRIISSPGKPPLADRFRAWACKALARGLPCEDESLRLEWALTLGWKTALTEEVSEPFVQAATYHIFAVDGLRMAIVFGIFFYFLRALGVPRAVCGVMLLPLLWFYVGLTGWPASAIRATVMLTVVIFSWVLKRPTDGLNSLFLAALIILTWQPPQLFQAGFQLSFFVVLCIILLMRLLQEATHRLFAPDPLLPEEVRQHWPTVVRVPATFTWDVLLTSFAAWVGSLPLVAYYFHIVTPVSTPANLVAVPLCALVLVSNLASLLLAGWFPLASELFNHAGWFLMEIIRVSSAWFAHWPKAYFYVPTPSLFTSGLYYGVLLAAATGWLFRPKRRAWKLAGVGVLLLGWGAQCWHECSLTRFTLLPNGGGAALYCDFPGTANDLLIDCGTTNAVQHLNKAFLRAQGLNRLPALVLTHGDLHHVGGAELLTTLFSAQQVCVSPIRFRSTAYRKTLEAFQQLPLPVRTLRRDDQLGPWHILHPEPEDRFSQADDNALVLAGTIGGTRVLLLSDLGHPGQNALLERSPDLRADIVITGLPSKTEALSDALLEAIQPRLIIVADAEFPVTERARPSLQERLAGQGVPVIYTRKAGAVTLAFRKDSWEARTMDGSIFRSGEITARAAAASPAPP
jgi:competence protein ComEC